MSDVGSLWTEIILLTLALWIVTHTIALEIPITANAFKPLSCQLCLAGWTCIAGAVKVIARTNDIWHGVVALAIWAGTVLIEALYQKLRTLVL